MDIFFVEFNMFNSLYQALATSSDYYIQFLNDNVGTKQEQFVTILVISVVLLSVQVIVLVPILLAVNRTQ